MWFPFLSALRRSQPRRRVRIPGTVAAQKTGAAVGAARVDAGDQNDTVILQTGTPRR